MRTTVEIEWDQPEEQDWLCADNISLALHAYCQNTKFKVRELVQPPKPERELSEQALLETEEQVRRETEKATMERCASELEESLNNESNEIDDEYALIAKWKKGGG